MRTIGIATFLVQWSWVTTSWALVSMNRQPIGLNIIYKKGIHFHSVSREEFHRQMGFRLVFQSKESNFDFILPMDRSGWTGESRYDKLCEKYSKLAMVLSCGVEFQK